MKEMKAEEGCIVKVNYTGKFSDGNVFDSSQGREPLMFKLGDHKVIKGFEEAVKGMKKGEKKTITIKKEDAYGERREQLVAEIPKAQMGNLPDKVELKAGMSFQLKDPAGNVIIATLKEVKAETIVLDLNHPLAGKDLTFDIELVEVMKEK